MMDSKPCVCGGIIRPKAPGDEAIAEAVRAHQAMPPHRAWRMGIPLREQIALTRDGLPLLVAK